MTQTNQNFSKGRDKHSRKHKRMLVFQQPANGDKPTDVKRFNSKDILFLADQPGFVKMKVARWLCGFKYLAQSSFKVMTGSRRGVWNGITYHQGERECARRRKQMEAYATSHC